MLNVVDVNANNKCKDLILTDFFLLLVYFLKRKVQCKVFKKSNKKQP